MMPKTHSGTSNARCQASEVRAAPGDKSFETLVKGLLAVSPADLEKARKADQEHKHGRKMG